MPNMPCLLQQYEWPGYIFYPTGINFFIDWEINDQLSNRITIHCNKLRQLIFSNSVLIWTRPKTDREEHDEKQPKKPPGMKP